MRITNYTFNAAAGTITFPDYAVIDIESFDIIANLSNNIIIYNFAGVGKGATVSGNVLTLDYDTSAMSNSDPLYINYQDAAIAQIVAVPELDDAIALLNRILISLVPLANTDSAQRQLVTIDSISAALTLSTVSAVTAITNALPTGANTIGAVNLNAGANTIGDVTVGGAGYDLFIAQQRSAYNISLLQT